MKITTFVQSSLRRTIATKVLVLILLAMATPAAVAQEVLFDSMSLPSAGEDASVYGMGPMQGFRTGSFACYVANVSVNLTPSPGPGPGPLPSIQLYLWSYPQSLIGFLDGPAYPNGVATYSPTTSLLLAPNSIYYVSAAGSGGGYLWGYTEPYVIGTPVGNPFPGSGEYLAMQVQVERVPPTISSQPQSLTVNAGDNATFSVTATDAPQAYQWSLNGTNITGATFSSLMISNVAQCDLGSYAVVLTNFAGSVTSSNAVLSMYPNIHTPFSGAVTYWGKDATFSVQAWGTGPLSYQWFRDGIALLDATNQTLTLLSIQTTNAGFYSVVVSSALGSVTNTPEQVVVEPAGVSLGFCPALTISGVIGYSYIIQSSANLGDTNAWLTLTNLTLTQPVELWVDTNVDASSPANSKYFYRVLPGQ